MDSSKTRLEYLFNCYNNKTATKEEEKELFQLLNKATDEELSDILHEEWKNTQMDNSIFRSEKSEEILNHILNQPKPVKNKVVPLKRRKYPLQQKLLAAAAVLVFLSFALYLSFPLLTSPAADQEVARVSNDAPPGGNKATLTLANGKTIVLNGAQNGVLINNGNIKVHKSGDGQVVYQALRNSDGNASSVNTLTTPIGGQYRIELPDGSKVWLNAASSLKFPEVFSGKARIVELSGEAYFEVSKNKDMPFKVRSRLGEVEVLGTHFNVMSYNDEVSMKTTLLEGSVRVNAGKEAKILKPGEQGVLNQSGNVNVVDDVDLEGEVAWKNGMFQFNDADIELVMRQVSRWYDLNVTYEGRAPVKRLTGKIPRTAKASELLSILEYSGLKFKMQGKNITVIN